MSEVDRLFHTMNKVTIQLGKQWLEKIELHRSVAFAVLPSKCFLLLSRLFLLPLAQLQVHFFPLH